MGCCFSTFHSQCPVSEEGLRRQHFTNSGDSLSSEAKMGEIPQRGQKAAISQWEGEMRGGGVWAEKSLGGREGKAGSQGMQEER